VVDFKRDWRKLGRQVQGRARAAAQAVTSEDLPRQLGDNLRGLQSKVRGNADRARRRWDDARAESQRRAELRRQRRRAAWQRFLRRLRQAAIVLAIVLAVVFALRLYFALTSNPPPSGQATPTPATR
jgi:ABC-type multidrug transport system fused ATPase/permease subunit